MTLRLSSVILSEAWRSRSERHAQSKDPYCRRGSQPSSLCAAIP